MTLTEQVKQAAAETAEPPDNARYRCRHVHADGRRCGSRALRRQNFCYYHTANRPRVENPRLRKQERNEFALGDPTDRTELQLTLGEVLRLIAANQIDLRRAGLLLYGLQIASGNIPKPKPDEQPRTVEEVVEDPELGLIAPQEESAPRPWTDREWDQKHKLEALQLKINQQLVQECDERISEIVKKHARELSEAETKRSRELSQQLMDLQYEVQCLRSARDPNLATKLLGENNLEELRIKRENAAKHLAECTANSPANSTVNSHTDSGDEPETEELDSELDSEFDDDDVDVPIVPYIKGSSSVSAPPKSTGYVPRLHPRIQQLVSRRANSQPPRKPVTKSTSAESATRDDLIVMSG